MNTTATSMITSMITTMVTITLADHHGLHDRDIASFCFIRDQPIPREALRLLLDALQQRIIGPPIFSASKASSRSPKNRSGRR